MRPSSPTDFYSRREIALAAGVSEADVLAVLGPAREFVPHAEAVRIGRLLAASRQRLESQLAPQSGRREPHLTLSKGAIGIPQSRSLPLAVSSMLHVGVI